MLRGVVVPVLCVAAPLREDAPLRCPVYALLHARLTLPPLLCRPMHASPCRHSCACLMHASPCRHSGACRHASPRPAPQYLVHWPFAYAKTNTVIPAPMAERLGYTPGA